MQEAIAEVEQKTMCPLPREIRAKVVDEINYLARLRYVKGTTPEPYLQ